ncbi:MAG: hypothetical protein IJB93_01830 [Clostridia bacterium]|nr:hypothetical protein [Clostridia bacterium]
MKKKDYIIAAIFSVIICVVAYFMVSGDIGVTVKVEGAPAVNQTVETPTTQPTTQPSTQAPTEAPTQGSEEKPDAEKPSAEAPKEEGGIPQGNEAILKKYTQLMDDAKTKQVGYNKVEYQAIPAEKANLGGILDKIMPVASTFFVDEETARANPENFPKGGDMKWFPLYETSKGCVLTDLSKIEKATSEKLADGNVKLTIELVDEMNPEPIDAGATTCSNHIGAMFNPIRRRDVDDVLQNNFAVKMLIKDLDFDLKYYDCTAELIYNPETDQIVSGDLYMHILIIINSGKVAGSDVTGDAVLDNAMHLTDFVY